MLDWAKALHEAIGIESPRIFIGLFALIGLLLFAAVGWLVDHGYRVKLREQSVQASAPQYKPSAAANQVTPQAPKPEAPDMKKNPETKQTAPQLTQHGPVNVGSGSAYQDNRGSTGNNTQNNYFGPPKPYILSPEDHETARAKLMVAPGELGLICIGKGCQTAESLLPAFTGTGWRIQRSVIGTFSGVAVGAAGATVDTGSGIHLMEKDADPNAVAALRSAMEAVGIKFESAPWRPLGPMRQSSGIILVIGNPE